MQVARGDVQARDGGRGRGQQAALQGQRGHPLLGAELGVDSQCEGLAERGQSDHVVVGEAAGGQGPGVEHPQAPLGEVSGTPMRERS